MHGKNVPLADMQFRLTRWIQHSGFQTLRRHDRARHREIAQCTAEFRLHLAAERVVLPNQQDELAHHFVPLVLEQFMTARGCDEALLDAGHFHAGRVDAKRRWH